MTPNNVRHFQAAREALGLRVVTATEAVIHLAERMVLDQGK